MKKIFSFIALCLICTSCNTQVVTDEAMTTNTGETPTQETGASQEPEIQVAANTTRKKILVTSSIIPLSSIVNTIGGDYVEVNNIVPAGVSPHGFDLSAKQMVEVKKSEIAFLTGLEHIDGFLEKAIPRKTQVHLADGIELLESTGHDDHSEEGHEDDKHDEEHEGEDEHSDEDGHEDDEHDDEHESEEHDDVHDKDPHVWLGKENIITIAGKVRDELSRIMPEQADYFTVNTAEFEAKLEKIYNDFASQTDGKTPKEFIVFHDAYNYLMQSIGMDLGLKVPFSENVLHESGTAHMAELVEEVEVHGLKHIFKEPQFSDGNLQKFVDEYGLILGTLDPQGTDPSASGYLDNIRSNLEAISKVYE